MPKLVLLEMILEIMIGLTGAFDPGTVGCSAALTGADEAAGREAAENALGTAPGNCYCSSGGSRFNLISKC